MSISQNAVMTYPLGSLVMSALPYCPFRHLFATLIGAFLLQFTIAVQWLHVLLTKSVSYVLVLVLPRSIPRRDPPSLPPAMSSFSPSKNGPSCCCPARSAAAKEDCGLRVAVPLWLASSLSSCDRGK